MTKIKIDGILKLKNKTRYWLAKETNTTYPNMAKLADGKTKSVQFDLLEKICTALSCKLTDIIEFVPEELEVQKPKVEELYVYEIKVGEVGDEEEE